MGAIIAILIVYALWTIAMIIYFDDKSFREILISQRDYIVQLYRRLRGRKYMDRPNDILDKLNEGLERAIIEE